MLHIDKNNNNCESSQINNVEIENTVSNNSKKNKFSYLKIFVLLMLIFFIVIIVFFICNRWFRYDDNSDIVGTWQIYDSSSMMTINNECIILDANTKLDYCLDCTSKTILFSTGKLSGVCHYRFSDDRSQVAFIESGDMDLFGTLFSDLSWGWNKITCSLNGVELSVAYNVLNKDFGDLSNTGILDIVSNGSDKSILLTKVY